jgi:hypothetical protein
MFNLNNLAKMAAAVLLAAARIYRALGLVPPTRRLGLSSRTGKMEIPEWPRSPKS